MKKLTASFAAATVLATALAAVPFAAAQNAATPSPAKPHGQAAKADPFAGGTTELELSIEACTANNFTLTAVYVFEASTRDLKRLGHGNVKQGANMLLRTIDEPGLEDEWDAFANSVSAPLRDDATMEAEIALAQKTFMLFSGEKGGVHMRNPRGAVAVLDEEGPGCAARLALKL